MHATLRRDPATIEDCVLTARGHLDRLRDARYTSDTSQLADVLKRLRVCIDRIEAEYERSR